METEKVIHKVRLNDYMTVDVEIPKELDASELLGLMTLAKRAVNLGEVNISSSTTKKKDTTTISERVYVQWTEQDIATLKKMWDKKLSPTENSRRIGKKLGKDPQKVAARYYYQNQG